MEQKYSDLGALITKHIPAVSGEASEKLFQLLAAELSADDWEQLTSIGRAWYDEQPSDDAVAKRMLRHYTNIEVLVGDVTARDALEDWTISEEQREEAAVYLKSVGSKSVADRSTIGIAVAEWFRQHTGALSSKMLSLPYTALESELRYVEYAVFDVVARAHGAYSPIITAALDREACSLGLPGVPADDHTELQEWLHDTEDRSNFDRYGEHSRSIYDAACDRNALVHYIEKRWTTIDVGSLLYLDRYEQQRATAKQAEQRRRKQVNEQYTAEGERGWILTETLNGQEVWRGDHCYDLREILAELNRPIAYLAAASYRDAYRVVREEGADALLEAASEIEHGSSD